MKGKGLAPGAGGGAVGLEPRGCWEAGGPGFPCEGHSQVSRCAGWEGGGGR